MNVPGKVTFAILYHEEGKKAIAVPAAALSSFDPENRRVTLDHRYFIWVYFVGQNYQGRAKK